ncbi:HPr(Ser) kinase/phosphatase [soil metagenome]
MQTDLKSENPQISIADFIEKTINELNLKVLAGNAGLQKKQITSTRIQKLGLALAGFVHYIHAGRIQIVGQSEISYLFQLDEEKRIDAINRLDLEKISCILITKDLQPPTELLEIADKCELPILVTEKLSSKTISLISNFLEEILAPQITLHGVLLDIYGLGVLILGDSGIGKSECALDLITRGHRLITDDSVVIKKIGERLDGTSPELTFEYLEIRGLGIINIRDLFGVSAIGKIKQIELIIEFKRWNDVLEIDRLGLETEEIDIFGIKINKFVLPVSAGRNLSTLVETAVRVHLVNTTGMIAAGKLIAKHTALLAGY